MSDGTKEFIRAQLMTFSTEQEVCDLLNITVEMLLETFDEQFNNYVLEEDDREA